MHFSLLFLIWLISWTALPNSTLYDQEEVSLIFPPPCELLLLNYLNL